MQPRVVGSSATSLGKSHDEGLNRIKGKRLPTTQYNRGHTTNLCSGVSGSSSGSSPFKIMLSDSGGFNARSSGSLVFRRVQGSNFSSTMSSSSTPQKEGIGCFGLVRGGAGGSVGGEGFNARHHKKFSLDHTGTRPEGGDVTYDIAFYRKMQQSVDELFDERRFAESNPNVMYNSKSSGDLVNSDESFASQGSSEFRRECFFNKSAPEHDFSVGIKSKGRSGSFLSKGGGNDKYLSLNDLLGNNSTTCTKTAVDKDVSSDLVDLYGDQSAQYSNSSSSSSHTTTSASTSSRKNSQVSFEEANKTKLVKLPPMKSEVSPRKFEKIYNLGTVDGSSTGTNNLRLGGPPFTAVGGKVGQGGTQKRQKAGGFITSLFKKGHRSVEKRTSKRGEGRDEKVNLVADDSNEQQHQEEETTSNGVRDSTTYDMIYTKRHIIAKQSADHSSLFRSDSQ